MRLHNERPLRNHTMSTIRTTYDDPALAGKAIERDAVTERMPRGV